MFVLFALAAAAQPALADDFCHGLAKWRIEAEAPAPDRSRHVESAYEQRRRKAGNPVPAPYDVEST